MLPAISPVVPNAEPPEVSQDDEAPVPNSPATGGPCGCCARLMTDAMAACAALVIPGKGVGPDVSRGRLLAGRTVDGAER